MNKFNGTAVAVITPFLEDKSIDFDALTQLINLYIEEGVDYLVVLGSTGEAATLSYEEKAQIRAHFIKVVNSRVPLVVGVSSNNTYEVVRELNSIDLTGFDAVLSVSPAYNKPSQEGIYQHYKAVAEASPLPVLLYNVPGRTGRNIDVGTVMRLASDFENIIGIKEAAGDMAQVLELIRLAPKDFLIISGDDLLALPLVLAGGAGVISVIAHSYPRAFSDMIRLGRERNVEEAFKIHYKLMPAIDLIFEQGNPTGIKTMLAAQGYCKNELRLPLVVATSDLTQRINEEINSKSINYE